MQNRASYKQEGCLSAYHRGVKNIFERRQYGQTKRQICFLKFKFRPRLLFIFTFEFINVLFSFQMKARSGDAVGQGVAGGGGRPQELPVV
jgi:hypothetical protein